MILEKILKLKSLIERLNGGESLESVKKDFIKNFSNVTAEEIAAAEQKLIEEGAKVEDVQKICSAHAELVRGKIENNFEFDINKISAGHPAKTLHEENLALEKFLNELEEKISTGKIEEFCKDFPKLLELYAHYGKKEFLFMPILSNYGVPGPSQVMWGVDDEIKKSVRELSKILSSDNFSEKLEKIYDVLNEIRDMIYREEKIFIPLTFKFFNEEDFLKIYRDSLEMKVAFLSEIPRWQEGDKKISERKNFSVDEEIIKGKINFPTGELNFEQLIGILKILPIDITFIDKDDIIKFFINDGKIFDRPRLAIGNNIYSCHPPQVIPVIEQLLTDFKNKKRTNLEVWKIIKGQPVSVGYYAVYDDEENYIGAVEFVQEYSKALQKFAK